jgi:hypothetical protein
MNTHRTPDVALWDLYRALREQWTHEDMLIGHRITWLILSEGLLFSAYVALSAKASGWLAFGCNRGAIDHILVVARTD